jgi:hypothetical protein
MVSRVPKFVEQKMAQKRRERKSGQLEGSREVQKPTVTFKPYEEARRKFEEKQAEKSKRMEERAAVEKIAAERQKDRRQITKLTRKKNNRGQPNMNAQLEILMKKFTKKNDSSQ